MLIQLPISKSIANRLLMCKAMRGDDISDVVSSPSFASWPDDVRLLATSLMRSQQVTSETVYNLDNCGTAFRFLTAYFAAQDGRVAVLTGCERMLHRPIGQLVDALRSMGASIEYIGAEGYPPLRITGSRLAFVPVRIPRPRSTQFVSALMLIGSDVTTGVESPYIDLTREVMDAFRDGRLSSVDDVERDWSSAAFWLERQVVLRSRGEVADYVFPGLSDASPQGDKVARQLFASIADRSLTAWDFEPCPDLYPAAAVACYEMGLKPLFTGVDSLLIKESDRLLAVEDNFRRIESGLFPLLSYGDHRIAMAFMAAGYPVDDEVCVSKSYPDYVLQLRGVSRIIPRRGINDDNLGKKHALKKLIGSADSDYVWLSDDDILFPTSCPSESELSSADMLILPLRMQPSGASLSLLDRLQMIEYSAIQGLTIRAAKRGSAVMCSGANMIVRREAWLACKDELHDEIASGDDMFLLESMKRRGMRVGVLDDSRYEAVCKAMPSVGVLLRQRMRWAGKAPAYSDRDVRRCGLLTVLSNLLVVACPPWLLVKWVVDMRLVSSRLSSDAMSVSVCRMWLDGLLLTCLYPWYMLICLIGGLFRKRW